MPVQKKKRYGNLLNAQRERERKRETHTHTYIYICVCVCVCVYMYLSCIALVVFERQTIGVFDRCSFSILFNFSESQAFAGEALFLGDISFIILLFSVLTSDISSP